MAKKFNPLAKLRPYQSQVVLQMISRLKRAKKDIQGQIALAAANAKMAASAKERESLLADIERRFKEVSQGIDAQLRELTAKVGETAHEAAIGTIGDKARIVRYDPARNERYFRMVHPSNEKNIAAVFTEKMSGDLVHKLRSTFVDVFRQGTVEGMTANEMQKALRDRWGAVANDNNNFKFIDRSGRRWEDARYLQMLVRTNAQRVARESSIDTFAENGITLQRITGQGTTICPVCAAWEGRIVQTVGQSDKYPTYEDALAAGVFHPNCTHDLLPVDELLDKDEIKRQGEIGKPDKDEIDDPEFMQAQKDELDEGRYIDRGLSREDARRAVTMDRLEAAIRGGVFSDDAASAARLLSADDLDLIRARGVPLFEPARNNETVGTTRHGRILTPREPTAQDILNLLGIGGEGGDPFNMPEPPQPPLEPPEAQPFPDNPDNLRIVRGLGGSTGAELVEDEHGQLFVRKRGGKAGGDAAEHLRSEAAADLAYSAMGVAVPECKLYERPGMEPVKLSKYIPDGTSLGDYLRKASPADRQRVLAEIYEHFDVDVVFGNRDVVGMSQDNILIDADGKVWRIDNGSAFGWRAQGARKSDWSKWPDELIDMRNPQYDAQGIFKDVSLTDVVIRSLGRDFDKIMELVPQQDRAIFRERVKEMQELGQRADGFVQTQHVTHYVDRVVEHSYGLVREGLRDAVPRSVAENEFGFFRYRSRRPTSQAEIPPGMAADWQDTILTAAKNINYHAQNGGDVNQAKIDQAVAQIPKLKKLAKQGYENVDYWLNAVKTIKEAAGIKGAPVPIFEIGKYITKPGSKTDQELQPTTLRVMTGTGNEHKLRNYVSLTDQVHHYIQRVGGDPNIIVEWQFEQADDSWNEKATLRKVVQEHVRPMPADATWVKGGSAKTGYNRQKKAFEASPEFAEKVTRSYAAYDAAVQVALEQTRFDHKDDARRVLNVIRTEEDSVISRYGISGKDKNKLVAFPRGACESHSIFKVTTVKSDEGTLVEVPFPLVKGLYFFERTPRSQTPSFLGDGENEFTCDARGLPTMYLGKVRHGQKLDLTTYKHFEKLKANK